VLQRSWAALRSIQALRASSTVAASLIRIVKQAAIVSNKGKRKRSSRFSSVKGIYLAIKGWVTDVRLDLSRWE